MQTEREYKTPSQGLHNLRFSSSNCGKFCLEFCSLASAEKQKKQKETLVALASVRYAYLDGFYNT
jgi:hypothetical protein